MMGWICKLHCSWKSDWQRDYVNEGRRKDKKDRALERGKAHKALENLPSVQSMSG